MAEAVRRGAKEGIRYGIIAGVIFGLAEILAAGMMGDPPLMPVRMFASIVLGAAALEQVALGGALVVGIVVHLVLAGLFGLVYGAANARFLSAETRTHMGRQAAMGLLFGIAIWLVNFQIIARILYPWFLMTPQFLQMVLHAVFFGLPLSLMYARAERRGPTMRRAPTPA